MRACKPRARTRENCMLVVLQNWKRKLVYLGRLKDDPVIQDIITTITVMVIATVTVMDTAMQVPRHTQLQENLLSPTIQALVLQADTDNHHTR